MKRRHFPLRTCFQTYFGFGHILFGASAKSTKISYGFQNVPLVGMGLSPDRQGGVESRADFSQNASKRRVGYLTLNFQSRLLTKP